MLRGNRTSLPSNVCSSKTLLPISARRGSVDLNQKQLTGTNKTRLGKLDSIIKSKVHYNASLRFLKSSWKGIDCRKTSQPKTPSRAMESQQLLSFLLKVRKLEHYMKTTFNIFIELFAHTKSKLDILRRLHGWEDEFGQFLFEDHSLNLKKISMVELTTRFGFDRKTTRSTSYYNKLKLLTDQVNRANQERYNLLSQIQMSKISQKLHIIEQTNQKFKRNYHGKDKHKYQNMAQGTIDRISAIKSSMWNTNRTMKYIEDRTGPIEVNQFFREQEKKLCYVQNVFSKPQTD